MHHISSDQFKIKEGHGFAKGGETLMGISVIFKLQGPKTLVLKTWEAKSAF